MKKISLKHLDHNATELLTKEQLKNVLGGYSPSSSRACKQGPCTVAVQESSGMWREYSGSCVYKAGNTNGGTGYPQGSCHCSTPELSYNPYITSNDGVSRCTN